MRFRQVLDDVKQDNDIDVTGLPQASSSAPCRMFNPMPGVVGGVLRQLDARH